MRNPNPHRRVIVSGTAFLMAAALATPARSDNGFTILGDYTLGREATLILENGTLRLGGDFNIAIDDPDRYDMTTATLQLIGLPQNAPQFIEVMSENLGGCGIALPDSQLYSIKRFRIGPIATAAKLVDRHDNAGGFGSEAMYVNELIIEQGTRLDLAGLWIFYDSITPADPLAPGSGVTIVDSVGGGGLQSANTTGPEIVDSPTSQSVCEGGTITLTAVAEGAEPLTYLWRRDGVILPDGADGNLTITNAQSTDIGLYDVVVFNDCGLAISDAATLFVWAAQAGDVNGDTFINGLDISTFLFALQTMPGGPASLEFCAGDINHDGQINQTDLNLFVAILLGN